MGAREERIARNEVLYREVNERVREVDDDLSSRGLVEPRALEEYFCECGLDDCMEKIHLTRDEYEHVRASPITFAVLATHVIPDVERVVARHDRFVTVEKLEGERAMALQEDPRSR